MLSIDNKTYRKLTEAHDCLRQLALLEDVQIAAAANGIELPARWRLTNAEIDEIVAGRQTNVD
ncbi:MAG: hypothetical protein P4L98_05685 [Ancalomicrobiaceae bacterium]|nr:hypothetical protein [Ancalomicrobiaceae bacterium]